MELQVLKRENTTPWRFPGRWPLEGHDFEPVEPWKRVDLQTWRLMRTFLRDNPGLF